MNSITYVGLDVHKAWTYRMQARVSPKLLARLEALPKTVRDIAWKAQVRLCNRPLDCFAAFGRSQRTWGLS